IRRATSGNSVSPYGLARRLTRSRIADSHHDLALLLSLVRYPVRDQASAASAFFTNTSVVGRAVFASVAVDAASSRGVGCALRWKHGFPTWWLWRYRGARRTRTRGRSSASTRPSTRRT